MSALLELYDKKLVQIASQTTTQQLYGESNVDDDYMIKNPQKWDRCFLHLLDSMSKKHHFVGIDCVVWDVNPSLLRLCANERLSMHLFVSNFKNCKDTQSFVDCIYFISEQCPTFLKTDCITEITSLLMQGKKNNSLRELPLQKPLPS